MMLRELPLVEMPTATSSVARVRDDLTQKDHLDSDVVGDRR